MFRFTAIAFTDSDTIIYFIVFIKIRAILLAILFTADFCFRLYHQNLLNTIGFGRQLSHCLCLGRQLSNCLYLHDAAVNITDNIVRRQDLPTRSVASNLRHCYRNHFCCTCRCGCCSYCCLRLLLAT